MTSLQSPLCGRSPEWITLTHSFSSGKPSARSLVVKKNKTEPKPICRGAEILLEGFTIMKAITRLCF